jgi:hypothetical protein
MYRPHDVLRTSLVTLSWGTCSSFALQRRVCTLVGRHKLGDPVNAASVHDGKNYGRILLVSDRRQFLDSKNNSKKHKTEADCIRRESNPSQLLGRQLSYRWTTEADRVRSTVLEIMELRDA